MFFSFFRVFGGIEVVFENEISVFYSHFAYVRRNQISSPNLEFGTSVKNSSYLNEESDSRKSVW